MGKYVGRQSAGLGPCVGIVQYVMDSTSSTIAETSLLPNVLSQHDSGVLGKEEGGFKATSVVGAGLSRLAVRVKCCNLCNGRTCQGRGVLQC